MMIKPVSALALLALLTACGQESTTREGPEAAGNGGYDQALQAAQAARKRAASVGSQWTTPEELIERAGELASEGKDDEAIALLGDARSLYELAIEQTQREAEAWRGRVIQ